MATAKPSGQNRLAADVCGTFAGFYTAAPARCNGVEKKLFRFHPNMTGQPRAAPRLSDLSLANHGSSATVVQGVLRRPDPRNGWHVSCPRQLFGEILQDKPSVLSSPVGAFAEAVGLDYTGRRYPTTGHSDIGSDLMPLFEYACGACGKTSELLLASSRSKAACPHCGSRKLRRLLSTFAAHAGAASSALPCASGRCPTAGQAVAGSCAGGKCPFSG
jgi:putative FmdB family regulatory protein